MSLWLDENLSQQLCLRLGDLWAGITHVQLVGLESASDEQVWNYARESGLTIVTKDADFHDRVILSGFPPKVIWLRFGNCTTAAVGERLRAAVAVINAFLTDGTRGILELR